MADTNNAPRDSAINSLGGDFFITTGTVTDFNAGLNRYTVATSSGGIEHPACLVGTGSGLFGARVSAPIPIGSPVVVAGQSKTKDSRIIYLILGVIPSLAANESLIQADIDALGAKVGFKWDLVHTSQLFNDPVRAFWLNFANYQALDAMLGEYGINNPFGPGVAVSNFFSFLKGSDRCGVWAFRDQELLRELARWHQIVTGSRSYNDMDDEGEVRIVDDLAMYPWEALGAFTLEDTIARETNLDPLDTEGNESLELPVELAEPLQRGIYRSRTLKGYIGDLHQRFVGLPILGSSNSGVDAFETNSGVFQGLFREHIGADGAYHVQSAKSIKLEKYSAIPFPVEEFRPEEPEGDHPFEITDGENTEEGNYKSSGLIGDGEDDHERKEFAYVSNEETPYARAGLGLELHGFMWKHSYAALRAHRRDWSILDEREQPLFQGDDALERAINTDPETFKLSQQEHWMRLPKFKLVNVDHRYQSVKIFASRSGINQLDDGTVLIEDGYGGQIIMSGGNVIITAPNDVVQAPGRNAVTMAGQDAIIRAARSTDVSAGQGDLRLKGEKNVMVIQNSDEEGGILIESRSEAETYDYDFPGERTNIAGLVIKSARTGALVAPDLSIIAATGGGSEDPGRIAFQTDGDVFWTGNLMHFDLLDGITMTMGDDTQERSTDTAERTLYEFRDRYCTLGSRGDDTQTLVQIDGITYHRGSLAMNGVLSVQGTVQVDGQVTTTDGYSGPSSDVNEISETLIGQLRTTVEETVGEAVLSDQRDDTAERVDGTREDMRNLIAPEEQPESYFVIDRVIEDVNASMRIEDDYGTREEAGFLLFQFRWQQYADTLESDEPLRYWQEPPVTFKGTADDEQETLPYPGFQAWEVEARFVRITPGTESSFYDLEEGFSKTIDPDNPNEEIQVEVETVVARNHYVVNSTITNEE